MQVFLMPDDWAENNVVRAARSIVQSYYRDLVDPNAWGNRNPRRLQQHIREAQANAHILEAGTAMGFFEWGCVVNAFGDAAWNVISGRFGSGADVAKWYVMGQLSVAMMPEHDHGNGAFWRGVLRDLSRMIVMVAGVGILVGLSPAAISAVVSAGRFLMRVSGREVANVGIDELEAQNIRVPDVLRGEYTGPGQFIDPVRTPGGSGGPGVVILALAAGIAWMTFSDG